jgi:hypothetical protein
VRRVHAGRVGQRQQAGLHRVVELAGHFFRSPTPRGGQIGPADIADQQRVPVSTPYGATSSRAAQTTTLIDSGVCPGWPGTPT